MSAPKQVGSIPTVTAPIVLPDAQPEMSRGRFLANVITAGVLGAVAVGLFVFALGVAS